MTSNYRPVNVKNSAELRSCVTIEHFWVHVGVAMTMEEGRRADSLSDTRSHTLLEGPLSSASRHKSCEMSPSTLGYAGEVLTERLAAGKPTQWPPTC